MRKIIIPTLSLWIVGLSSAGKSTVARELIERLRAEGHPSILLDGDHVRTVFGNRLGYDRESRRAQTERVLKLAQLTSEQGIIPVAAIIHPFEDGRAKCRKMLPGYFEVHLQCDINVCRSRDTKNVYPNDFGDANNVVGMVIDFEDTVNADLVLDSANIPPEDLAKTIYRAIQPGLTATPD
jgi:adenylylsulfate kinase-like enzyme